MLVNQAQIDRKKEALVNMSRVLNTSEMNKNVQTQTYTIDELTTISTSAGNIDACGGVTQTCSGIETLEVTASQPITANDLIKDCALKDVGSSLLSKKFDGTLKRWGNTELQWCYEQFTGTDYTTELQAYLTANPDASIYDEINFVLKAMIKGQDLPKQDLIIVVNEDVASDLAAMDLMVGDLSVRNQDQNAMLKTAANKFMVKDVVSVPAHILSGHQPAGDTDNVRFRIYIYDYTRPHLYCPTPLVAETYSSDKHSNASRIFGKEYIGFGMYDAIQAEYHVFYADGII